VTVYKESVEIDHLSLNQHCAFHRQFPLPSRLQNQPPRPVLAVLLDFLLLQHAEGLVREILAAKIGRLGRAVLPQVEASPVSVSARSPDSSSRPTERLDGGLPANDRVAEGQ
jgi:hypothetical protein